MKHCRKLEVYLFPAQGFLGETGKLILFFLYEECEIFNELKNPEK
jgi:hypothetical protein